MRTKIERCIVVAFCVVLGSGARPWQALGQSQTEPAFSLSITAPRDSVESGSEIRVKVVLTNTSSNEIHVPADKSRAAELAGYSFEVRDGENKTPLITRYYWVVSGGKAPKEAIAPDDGKEFVVLGGWGEANVKPGKTTEDTADVSKLYDLRKPGKYAIHAERTDGISKTVVKSNTIVVTVTPRGKQ
jgi:hypothetical protein